MNVFTYREMHINNAKVRKKMADKFKAALIFPSAMRKLCKYFTKIIAH